MGAPSQVFFFWQKIGIVYKLEKHKFKKKRLYAFGKLLKSKPRLNVLNIGNILFQILMNHSDQRDESRNHNWKSKSRENHCHHSGHPRFFKGGGWNISKNGIRGGIGHFHFKGGDTLKRVIEN